METLKLQTNVPETIALAFADGKPVESRFGGDQVMFTLTDGRRAYLAPFVAQKIASAGIQAGELFEICKRETVAGNRRSVDYQIRTDLARSGGAPASGPVAPSLGISPHEHNAAVSAAARTPAMPMPACGAAELPAPSAENSASAAMAAAGRLAVDAVLEIEGYARSRGMTDFAFGADNIQRILVSLYIDSRKGGR